MAVYPVNSSHMDRSKSEALFARAQQSIPGGVNSPVRAFRGVGGTPPFIARGQGSRIFDVDGNEYIDYVCSWGPLHPGPSPAGHCRRAERSARIRHQLRRTHRAAKSSSPN